MTRVVALCATLTLALAVLFRSPVDYRTTVCVIVSVAAMTVVLRCLVTGKLMGALPFLAIMGVFTPFHVGRFSHGFVSIFDMAGLALFASAPIILRSSLRNSLRTSVETSH